MNNNNICQYFSTVNGCSSGAMCPFLHLQHKPKEDQNEVSFSQKNSSQKVICINFNSPKGCRFGNKCKYSHILDTTSTKDVKVKDRNEKINSESEKNKPVESDSTTSSGLKVVIVKKKSSVLETKNKVQKNESGTQQKVFIQKPIIQRPILKSLEDQLNSTKDPIEQAKLQQRIEIGQIERRFPILKKRNLENFGTELSFNLIPSDPDFPFDLDAQGLQVKLTFDQNYPTSNVKLNVLNKEIPINLIRNIENTFNLKSSRVKMTLLHLVNYLDRDLEKLLSESIQETAISFVSNEKTETKTEEKTRSFVSHPEELSGYYGERRAENSESTTEEEISSDEEERVLKNLNLNTAGKENNKENQHKGIQIKFLELNLVNISLIKCQALNIVVKCLKCKNKIDIKNLIPNLTKFQNCETCNEEVGCRYRQDFIHAGNTSIGYLDLSQCTVYDLLPTTFFPTCSECSFDNSKFTFKQYQFGNLVTIHCEECFLKMTLNLDAVKFINLSPGPFLGSSNSMKKKKMKKGDGLIVGESLPKSGTCKHYKRSYRWFRFPCCSKLFPCDECHHELSLDCKENILANRVVCGFCSREQKFDAKNSICICGKDMSMSSAGKSFWEGGKGNRNKSKMSKNDSKKYTGLSKTVSKKKLK